MSEYKTRNLSLVGVAIMRIVTLALYFLDHYTAWQCLLVLLALGAGEGAIRSLVPQKARHKKT